MKQNTVARIAALAGLVGMAWAAGAQVKGFGLSETVDQKIPPAPTEALEGEPAAEPNPIETLSVREKVSQLMVVTVEGGNALTSADADYLRRYPPGGVVLTTNLRPSSTADYIKQIRSAPSEQKLGIPLFIATNIFDLPKRVPGRDHYFIQFPSLMSLAAANDPEATRRLAQLVATHLKLMGFNMHLGPSLELAPTLEGAPGGLHFLGHSPEFAAKAGAAFITALTAEGVLATPMGFPGGGANRLRDEPAVLVTPKAILAEHDLAPYRAAIAQGAPLIHVGTTYVPTLDPKRQQPACMSEAVMRGMLRGELGYTGVILAGPFDVKDVGRLMDPRDAALEAIRAGADMLLYNNASTHAMRAVDHIVAAVEKDELPISIIDTALERVIALKKAHDLAARPQPEPRDAAKLEKKREYPKEAHWIERRSITLVKNAGNVLPLQQNTASLPLGVTGVVGVQELHDGLEKHIKHVAQQPIATARHLEDIYDFEIRRLTRHSQGLRTVICVFDMDLKRIAGLRRLIQEFKAQNIQVVLVLVGYPGRLDAVEDADAIVLAYCGPESLAQSMASMAEVLVGKGPVTVLPFVRDLYLAPNTAEAFNVFDVIRSPVGTLPVAVGDRFPAGTAVAYNPVDAVKKVEWDFGDGTRKKGVQVEHAYTAAGHYPITITVTDVNGETVTSTLRAIVGATDATAQAPAP